jgi:hypothetical protein
MPFLISVLLASLAFLSEMAHGSDRGKCLGVRAPVVVVANHHRLTGC